MEMVQVEPPAVALAAAVLAHDAVKPAVEAAGEMEIGRVDGEDESVVEDGLVEPVGDDQLDAIRSSLAIRALLPLVYPREAVTAAFSGLADRRRDGGRLQPVQRRLEALVVA